MADEISRHIIIPSGFRSSERQMERVSDFDQRKLAEELARIDDETQKQILLREESKPKEFDRRREGLGIIKPTILDVEKVDINLADAQVEPLGLNERATELHVEKLPSERLRRLRQFGNVITKGSSSLGRNIQRAATSETTKKFAKATTEHGKLAALKTGKASKKVGRTTAGVSFLVGKRLEERILDKPRAQKPLFRALEARERRLLGLPVSEVFTREDLRLLALGYTPPSMLRYRRAELDEMDNLIAKERAKLPTNYATLKGLQEKLNKEILQLNQQKDQSSETALLILRKKEQLNDILNQIAGADAILKAIKILEGRKEELFRSTPEIPDEIRTRAFTQALRASPSIRSSLPVGSLAFEEEKISRRRGRPRKSSVRPEIRT